MLLRGAENDRVGVYVMVTSLQMSSCFDVRQRIATHRHAGTYTPARYPVIEGSALHIAAATRGIGVVLLIAVLLGLCFAIAMTHCACPLAADTYLPAPLCVPV